MEDSSSEGLHSGSMSDDFADSLMDNEIVDAVDLTHEMTAHANGDPRIRFQEEMHVTKKKRVDTLHYISHKNTPSTHVLHPPSNPPFSLPPPSMIVSSASLGHGAVVAEAISLPPHETTVIDGVTYNNRGYEICGALNKFNKPCQRIGRNCPFHGVKEDPSSARSPQAQPLQLSPTSPGIPSTPSTPGTPNSPLSPATPPQESSPKKKSPSASNSPSLPIKKGPYKRGWTKDEHIRFLKGLQIHGKGSWKEISAIVGTRSPSQIQVHAHRYFLRQQQGNKNKRSIHDFTMDDLSELEGNHSHSHQSSAIQPSNSSYASHAEVVPQPQLSSQPLLYAQQVGSSGYSGQAPFVPYQSSSSSYGNSSSSYGNSSGLYNSYSSSGWSFNQPNYGSGFPVQGGVVTMPPLNQQHANTQTPTQWAPYPNTSSNPSYTNSAPSYSNSTPSFSNSAPSFSNSAPSYSNGAPSYSNGGSYGQNGVSFLNGPNYTTGQSYSMSSSGQSSSNAHSFSAINGPYSSGSSYATNGSGFSAGGSSYATSGSSYSNGSSSYATSARVPFLASGPSFPPTGVGYSSGGQAVESFRIGHLDSQNHHLAHQDDEHGPHDHFRKQEDRDYGHGDYNKELQGDKSLFLKDLPDIFLRSEIANEPIK